MDLIRFNLTGGSDAATPLYPRRTTFAAGGASLRRPYAPLGLLGCSGEVADDGQGPAEDPSPIDPADEDPRRRRMRAEAVLLVTKAPVSTRKLAQLARLADGTEARTMIRQLNDLYEEHGRAIRIEKVAGGFRMVTRPALAPWLRRLSHVPSPIRLSTPMMETLAVVAYRQPVSRADTEAVRGVACGELLRQLMERDLIRMTGRSEELGRPYLYGTTKRFLQLFGLTGTDALPTIDWHTIRDEISAKSTDDLPSDPPPTEVPTTGSLAHESPHETSTSTKESVVSTALASAAVLSEPDSPAAGAHAPLNHGVPGNVVDPVAVIEDEEDDLYEGGFETDDDEEIDDDEFSDDWDDEDDEEDDDDDEEDELDDDEDDDDEDVAETDSDWEEVGDDDDDEEEDWDDDEEEEDDDWEEDDESAEDDEDWTE